MSLYNFAHAMETTEMQEPYTMADSICTLLLERPGELMVPQVNQHKGMDSQSQTISSVYVNLFCSLKSLSNGDERAEVHLNHTMLCQQLLYNWYKEKPRKKASYGNVWLISCQHLKIAFLFIFRLTTCPMQWRLQWMAITQKLNTAII